MKQKPNVLLLETVTEEAYAILDSHAHVIQASAPDQGLESIQGRDIDGIVTRGKGQVDSNLIDHCKGLRAIARCGVGLDNVDVDHATSLQIKVINAPGSNADTVAEHTLALMLSAQRQLFTNIAAVNQGNWAIRKSYGGDELRGKTLGIIGMGDIGQRVAALAGAFGMQVIFYNRTAVDSAHTHSSLKEVLDTAHIISLHLPLTIDTRGLLTAASFQNNPHRPILINTARGGIISDAEVVKALEKGWLSAFAADVLEQEPPDADCPLLHMDNVYLTPHAASLTARTYNHMCVMTVQNLIDVLHDKPIDSKYIFNL